MPRTMAERIAGEKHRGEKYGRKKRYTSDKALRKIADLTVMVGGKPLTFNLEDEVSIDGEPDDVLSTHVQRYLFWRRLLVSASKARRDAEHGLEEYTERLRHGYRIRLDREAQSGGPRVTESLVSSEVRTDPDYGAKVSALNGLLETEETCRMMVDAFDHRKTVLMKAWKADTV